MCFKALEVKGKYHLSDIEIWLQTYGLSLWHLTPNVQQQKIKQK